MTQPECPCPGCLGEPVCSGEDKTCPGCISGEHGRDRRHEWLRRKKAVPSDVAPG